MILVTSAYGNNGRRLIPILAAKGIDVRALNLSDKTEELKKLGAEEVIVGNALDPVILDIAMDGIKSVFHVGPSFHPQEAKMGIVVINAASAAEIEHLSMSRFYIRKLVLYCNIEWNLLLNNI